MDREKEIEILIKDRCSKSEAHKLLKNGTVIYEDLEKNFEAYAKEWALDECEREKYLKMIKDNEPMPDWGIVTDGTKKYYIAYVN